jgi:subtilisin family serine protease
MQLSESSKMDPRLRQVVDQARGGGDVRARSLELGATAADLRLPVLLNAPRPAAVGALSQEIRAAGGEVTATHDASVWSLLPPAAVDRLAASPNVHYLSVQEQMRVEQQSGGTTPATQSQRATRVEALHARGIRGQGVKVGIIDQGFGGYGRLRQAGRVPTPKATQSFPASRPLENSVVHGAACAEIIASMAPDVELYLAVVDGSQGNSAAAAQWLIAQGVDIISYSMGSSGSPGDGSGSLGRLVDQSVTENGVLWVVSSGNSGERHWMGPNTDADRDELIDIGRNRSYLLLSPAQDEIDLTIRWNDWGPDPRRPTSSQDIDAFLMLMPPEGSSQPPMVVAEAIDDQDGTVGPPLEKLVFKQAGIKGRIFAVVLRNSRVTRPLDVHVFLESYGQLAPQRVAGSVLSPASSQHAIAVGAWEMTTSQLAPYSSQGPTDDNRLKPEVAAPSGGPSLAYQGVFDGTSASCPHAAGFAALIKQMNPSLKGLALRAAVMQSVEPKGTPVPNMMFGYGWVDGSRIAAPAVAGGMPAPPAPSTPSPAPSAPAPSAPAPSAPAPSAPLPPASSPAPAAASASARVSLPLTWGGNVPAEVLDRLRLAGGTPDFLTRVVSGRDLYRIGDGLRVGFKSAETCEHLLLHRSSRGEYTLLSPRQGMVTTLAPGQNYVLPSDKETFQVTPPVGAEEVVLVCARKPVDLSATNGKPPAGLVVTRHVYQVSQ